MATPDSATRTVIELWPRRLEPDTHDLVRALRAASQLEAERAPAPGIRALASRLVQDLHDTAGWDSPSYARFPLCETEAEDARTTSATVVEAVRAALATSEDAVLLAGTLGAARSLFGAWDLLPRPSAELILLGDTPPRSPSTAATARWTHAGPLASTLRQHSEAAELSGRQVLIPRPELAAAQLAPRVGNPAELDVFLFCAAAFRAVASNTWPQVVELSAELGHGRAPESAVVGLGLEEWLELRFSRRARLASVLRRLLGG